MLNLPQVITNTGVAAEVTTNTVTGTTLTQMFKKFTKYLSGNKCFLLLYYFVWQRKPLEHLKYIRKSRTTEKEVVLFYCYHPSHYQTTAGIIESLAQSFQVFVVCNFTSKKYSPSVINNEVAIIYESDVSIVPLFKTSLYITPFVGQQTFFPAGAARVHFLVSLASIYGVYGLNMFDEYDYVFCAGEHQISELKEIFRTRNIRNKCLIRGGYPKLDAQLSKFNSLKLASNPRSIFTVVYAPTHIYEVNEELASLDKYGFSIVQQLLAAGFKVIFRPHPVSFTDASIGVVDEIIKTNTSNPNFEIDRSADYFNTYQKADVMITDLSGTGFTFAFTFEKPVLFFAHNTEAENGLTGIQYQNREDIGEVARNTSEMLQKINLIKNNYPAYQSKIVTYRNGLIFNIGHSEEYFVNNIHYITGNRKHADWVYI